MLPDDPRLPADPGDLPNDDPDSDEEMVSYAGDLRRQCVDLGAGTAPILSPPSKLSEKARIQQYFAEKALFEACIGKGEAKATICRALYLKDEEAAKAFADGSVQEALDIYRIAFWLLRDDHGNFHPSSTDPVEFEDKDPCLPVAGRFEGAPDPTISQEDVSVPTSSDSCNADTQLPEAESMVAAATEAAAKRYGSDASYADQAAKLRQVLRLNIAACALKIKDWSTAREVCSAVLRREPDQIKALFRKAQACEGEGDIDEAIRAATAAVRLQPNLREARNLLTKLKKDKASVQKTYKSMFSGGYSDERSNISGGSTASVEASKPDVQDARRQVMEIIEARQGSKSAD
eukprot:gnl/MRDRNA2_/MRDRNA2_112865_c0_seq1.p1 gnl/MRDRNA2_/MRDRNA2_112865_c0~~gnl/MRDRNA2_/MRDRNA2_112865_c0_seq1.p1  ORF type:complete len:348 (+),score=74.13 gnl/MRDRNA2_/MRDRNA2_112865_c0_seq1:148-1191(+)